MKLFKLQDFSDPAKQTAIAEFAAKKYGRAVAPDRIGVIARSPQDLEVIDLDEYESPAGYAKTLGAQAVAGIPSTVAAGLAFPVGGLASGLASSPTGPLAVGLGLAGGTVAAGAAGYAAAEATQAGLRKVAPSAARELENQRLINPKTATLGQIASGFGLAKNLPMGFRKLVGERLGKEAAEVTGKDIAKILGAEVGVNVAAEAGIELAVEGDLDPMRLGAAALGAPVQLRQTGIGRAVTTAGERLAGRIAPQTARKLGYASNPELPNEQGLPIPDSAADRNAAIDELLAAGDVDQAKAREFYQRIMRSPLPADANVELPALRRVAEDAANKRRLNDPEVRSDVAAKAYDALQAGAQVESLPDYPFLRTLVSEYNKDKTISRDQFIAAARNENVQAGLQAAREQNIPVVARQAELQSQVRQQLAEQMTEAQRLAAANKERQAGGMLALRDQKRTELLELKKQREIDKAYAERNKQLALETSQRGDEFRAMQAAREAENAAAQKQLEREIAEFESGQAAEQDARIKSQLSERERLNEEAALGNELATQLQDVQNRREKAQAIFKGVTLGGEDVVLPTDAYSRRLAKAIKEGTLRDGDEVEQVATMGVDARTLEAELNKFRVIRLQELGNVAAGQLPVKQPGQVMDASVLGRTAQRLNLGAVGTPGTKASPPVPESKEQVQAQVDLTANPKSAKAVTVLDAGSPMPANVPDGLDVQASGGRVVISNPKQISKEAAKVVGAQDIVPAAPLGQSTKEVAAPSAVAVTTSTPTTKDVVSTLVTTQAEIDAAKKAQQAAVPGGTTEVKPAAEVVENRLPASFDKAEADRIAAGLQAKSLRYAELVEQGQGQAPEAVALRAELDAAARAQQEARAREVRAGTPVSQPVSQLVSQPVQPAKQKRAKKEIQEKPAVEAPKAPVNTAVAIEAQAQGSLGDSIRAIMAPDSPESFVQIRPDSPNYIAPTRNMGGIVYQGTKGGDVGVLHHPTEGNIYFNPSKIKADAILAKFSQVQPKTIEPAQLTAKLLNDVASDTSNTVYAFIKPSDAELPDHVVRVKVQNGELLVNTDKMDPPDALRAHQNDLLNSRDPNVKQFSLSAPIRSSFELVDKLVGGAYRNWTRSVLDGLRALKDPRGAKTASAHEQSHNYATTKYAADYLDYKRAFDGLSAQDKGAINQYLFQMKYHGFSPMVLPPRLANRVDAIRAVLQRQIYDRYAAGGPYVNDGRMPDMDLNYVPETISKEALGIINAGDSPRYQALKQDFLAHKVNMGHSHDEAAEMWANMVKAYQRGSEMSEPTYNAVRKIEGSGLPASMRAPLEEALFKHSAMTHKDVAWFKFFQQDPEVAQFLGLTDDGKGGQIPLNDPSPEPIAEVFMKNATSWRNYNKTWMDAIGRLASAGRLGTVTGARDFFMTVPNLSAYLDIQDMPSVARAFSKLFSNNTEAAVRAGAINPEKVQGQDMDLLAPHTDAKWQLVERLSDVLRKYQGRELFEAKGRQMAFELGRIVAADRIQAGYNPQWFNRLFGDNSWKTLSKSELLDAVGRKFVEKAQGNYGMQGLPGYLLDGTSSPFSKLFLKLARFQVERFNNWYKDAWTPAVKGETYAPLLKSIMGGLVGAGAMNELLGALGIKPNAMLPSELAKMGNPGNKELAYTIFSYLDTAGTIGVLGNLVYSGLQYASGEIPRTVAVSLGIDSMLNAVARLHQFGKALDDGAESPEAWAKLAGAIARDNIQLFRTVSNAMQDRNMAREERIYKRQTGQLRTTSAQMLDDPFDPTKDLEAAESEQEALAALPGVARKMQATGVVPVIRSPLRSLEVNPLAPGRPNFYQWLERAQGTPVAQAQGEKDLRGQEMARGKNQLIGMARQQLIERAAEMQRLRDMQRVMEP